MESPAMVVQGPPCAYHLRYQVLNFSFLVKLKLLVLNGSAGVNRLVAKWVAHSVPLGVWGLRAI